MGGRRVSDIDRQLDTILDLIRQGVLDDIAQQPAFHTVNSGYIEFSFQLEQFPENDDPKAGIERAFHIAAVATRFILDMDAIIKGGAARAEQS
jgi:hypothetical protein